MRKSLLHGQRWHLRRQELFISLRRYVARGYEHCTLANTPTLGQIANDCLNSVPVDAEGDVLVIQELKQLAQFQSNLNYMKEGTLRDGPDGVIHNEPVDILGELDLIATGVQNGTYGSEFEVQFAISQLLQTGGDNHFSWRADIFDPLRFIHQEFTLVSLS